MADHWIGLIGVVVLFAFTFAWTWTEDYLRRRAKRKYDKQMDKYNPWKRNTYSRLQVGGGECKLELTPY